MSHALSPCALPGGSRSARRKRLGERESALGTDGRDGDIREFVAAALAEHRTRGWRREVQAVLSCGWAATGIAPKYGADSGGLANLHECSAESAIRATRAPPAPSTTTGMGSNP